jgi:hypothetical protein
MSVIDSNNLERDAGGKVVSTFPHPALVASDEKTRMDARLKAGHDALWRNVVIPTVAKNRPLASLHDSVGSDRQL